MGDSNFLGERRYSICRFGWFSMLIRRHLAVALLFVLSTSSAVYAESPKQESKPTGKASLEYTEARPLPVVVINENERKTAQSFRTVEAAHDLREQSDLRAQWSTAYAAWLQTLFSFVGLIGLVFTVLYTRKAWKESALAAKAALDAAAAAQQSAHADIAASRPWIQFGIEVASPLIIKSRSGSSFIEIRINATNIGKYPAVFMTFHVQVLPNGDDAAVEAFMAHSMTWQPFPRTLFPGEKYSQVYGCRFQTDHIEPSEGMTAVIAVSAQYQIGPDSEVHRTPAVLSLLSRDPNMHLNGGYRIPLDQGDIPAAKLARGNYHGKYFAPT